MKRLVMVWTRDHYVFDDEWDAVFRCAQWARQAFQLGQVHEAAEWVRASMDVLVLAVERLPT